MLSVSDFTHIIQSVLPEPHAGLLSGILFGTKMSIDPLLKQALVTTGTLHIIALSGMNITILTNIVTLSLLWIFSRRIATFATISVIIGFIFFVGPSASIIRAALMGGITLIGILFGKNAWALWSWGVAVVLMLVAKPVWITDLSFQLSVLASLGMILFGNQTKENRKWKVGVEDRESKMDKRFNLFSIIHPLYDIILNDLRTTLAAQTLTIPLLLFTFGRLSFISPLTNVLIVWTLPIITVLGFFVAICGFFFLPLGQLFAWISWIFLEYIIQIIMWTSKIPFASIEW
jgi:competence protein ComEC